MFILLMEKEVVVEDDTNHMTVIPQTEQEKQG